MTLESNLVDAFSQVGADMKTRPPMVVWNGTGAPPVRPSAPVVEWFAPEFPSTAVTGDHLVRG